MNLDKYKFDLGVLNASRSSLEDPSKNAKLFERIPIKKMYDQALYIEKELLPRIEQQRGKDHADYKFFRDVFKSLAWAMVIVDRTDWLQKKLTQSELFLSVFKERCEFQEKELAKYTTMEDLMMTDGMDHIATAVKNRIEHIIKNA